jgi:hypothetical protein
VTEVGQVGQVGNLGQVGQVGSLRIITAQLQSQCTYSSELYIQAGKISLCSVARVPLPPASLDPLGTQITLSKDAIAAS